MKVEDGTVTIEVTEADIAKGVPGDSSLCAIACAFRRHFEDINIVEIEDSYIRIETDEYSRYGSSELSFETLVFIERFDNEMVVEPFSFEVELGYHEQVPLEGP